MSQDKGSRKKMLAIESQNHQFSTIEIHAGTYYQTKKSLRPISEKTRKIDKRFSREGEILSCAVTKKIDMGTDVLEENRKIALRTSRKLESEKASGRSTSWGRSGPGRPL